MENVNTVEYVAASLSIFVSAISLTCSIITLYLIRKIGRWNGFILMVTSMTVSQIIYDLTFALEFPSTFVFYSNIFVSTFGGVSVTLWTNVMSGIVVYMVLFLTPLDSMKLYPIFFVICVVLPLCYAVISDALLRYGYLESLDYSYNIIRLSSIGLNFIAYFITIKKLGLWGKLPKDHPLVILTSRLKYYPIVQIICRIWPSVFELTYGNTLDHASYKTGTASSDIELILYGIMLPSAGIGFFIVFLAVQPMAYAHWRELFRKRAMSESVDLFRNSVTIDNPLSENDTFQRSISTTTSPFSRLDLDEEQLINEIRTEIQSRSVSKEQSSGHNIDRIYDI